MSANSVSSPQITPHLTIHLVLTKLRPGILQPEKRCVRCLGHIINSAAQAFLFAGDRQSLEEVQFVSLSPISVVEAEFAFWRKKEPLGGLHNITAFIRRTPQRREDFQRCCKAYKVEDSNFEGMCRFSPRAWHLLASNLRRAHGYRGNTMEFNLRFYHALYRLLSCYSTVLYRTRKNLPKACPHAESGTKPETLGPRRNRSKVKVQSSATIGNHGSV